MNPKKAKFFSCLADGLLDVVYYSRKGDNHDLTADDVEKLIESGEITLTEIQQEVTKFFTNSFKMPIDLEAIPDLRKD